MRFLQADGFCQAERNLKGAGPLSRVKPRERCYDDVDLLAEPWRYLSRIAMEGTFSPKDLEALQNIICPPNDDSDTDDDLPQAGARKLGEFTFTID